MDDLQNPRNGDRCSTRRVVQSNCRTEEVEPGKFLRKCEKTEQLLRDCVGRPTEVVESLKEYTEDDVTEIMSGSSMRGSSDIQPFAFPGLRSDIEAIERDMFGGISSFFNVANEMKKDFFRALDDLPLFGSDPYSSPPPSSGKIQEVPIDDYIQKEPTPKRNDSGSGDLDLSGLARDV